MKQTLPAAGFNLNSRSNEVLILDIKSANADKIFYYYTLIADGKEVDTKKMILTK